MKIAISIAAVVVAAILGAYLWVWGAQTAHGLTLFWVAGWPVIVLAVIIPIALGVGAYIASEEHDAIAWLLGIGSAVFCAAGIIVGFTALPYAAAHSYTASVKTVQQTAPSYDQRTPYQVAAESSNRNLQDITGDAQNTKSLPGEGDHGEWDTLVIRRGIFQGYEATQSIQTPLYGTVESSQVTICKFDPNNQLRLSGAMPHNNLNRVIDANTPWNVTWDGDDAYSYCQDDSTPIVVVPLKQLSGFFGATWTFYGDAVYNGKTGAFTVLTDAKQIEALKGSVYPLSLAEDTRNAYQASGGYWDWVQGRSGYDTTDSDQDDPNGGNSGEFNLHATAGGTDFVTPLLPRGSSSNVVAVGVVNSHIVKPGTRNALTVYRYNTKDERQAPSTVENQIRTTYSHMSDWASGLKVYEVVPNKDGLWVASLGFRQSVDYRAYITANGDVTLYNSKGQELDNGGNPVATTTGTGTTGGTGTPVTIGTNVDLSKLSTSQLTALGQKILTELSRRSQK